MEKSYNSETLYFFNFLNIMFGGLSKKSENASILDPSMRMHGTVTVGTKGQIVITKYGTFVGFIKTDDVAEFIELLRKEANLSGK